MPRNAQETRSKLVKAAYEQIHANGFQGMRVDQVLKQTKLQKGAFYHHFGSKTELGYAVIEEEIGTLLQTVWLEPIADMDNPITDIPKLIADFGKRTTPLMKQHGCPLNNLAQEMSTLDEGFRQRIEASFTLWIDTLAEKLEEAKTKNYISKNTDSQSVARFLIAVFEGCIGITKVEGRPEQFQACHKQISFYLNTLTP